MNLLNLFDSILVPVLEDWIEDTDLGQLDIAVCNCQLRPNLLSLMSKCKIFNSNVTKDNLNEYYEWIALRKMRLRNFNLNYKDESRVSAALKDILSRTDGFDMINASSGKLLAKLINKYGFTVLGCSFNYTATDEDVLAVVSCCPILENLQLDECQMITDNILPYIHEHCPMLKKVDAPKHLRVDSFFQRCSQLRSLKASFTEPEFYSGALESVVKLHFGAIVRDSQMKELLGLCPNLEDFTVVSDKASDSTIEALTASCKKVSAVMFESKNITDVGCVLLAITYQKGLTSLSLFETSITDEGVQSVASNCPNLLNFLLCGSKAITNRALKAIETHCSLIERISVSECTGITEVRLSKIIHKFPNLKCLGFQRIPTTDAILYHSAVDVKRLKFQADPWSVYSIAKNAKRSELKFFGLRSIQNGYDVFGENPRLISIEFEKMKIGDDVIAALVTECPLLSSVTIIECPALSTRMFPYFGKCQHLTRFTIQGFLSVRDKDALRLLKDKASMKLIEFPFCGVTDSVLNVIGNQCPALELLNVRSSEVTTEGLIGLLNCCPKLKKLNIRGCQKVSDDFMRQLSGRKMRKLYIEGCRIDWSVTKKFMEENPSTTVEY